MTNNPAPRKRGAVRPHEHDAARFSASKSPKRHLLGVSGVKNYYFDKFSTMETAARKGGGVHVFFWRSGRDTGDGYRCVRGFTSHIQTDLSVQTCQSRSPSCVPHVPFHASTFPVHDVQDVPERFTHARILTWKTSRTTPIRGFGYLFRTMEYCVLHV